MDVEELLQQHGMFASMVKKMGGNKGMLNQMKKGAAGRGGGNPGAGGNPMAQMAKMLPPGMMEQMGGASGIQGMMEQMGWGGGAGGMPDMGKMQEMMASMGIGGIGGGGGAGRGRGARRKN
jgi:signal recognition particle subunit SRP54